MIGINRNSIIQIVKIYITAVLGLLILTGQAHAIPSEQWNKTFGGAGRDVFKSVVQTEDGGFILAGSTASNLNSLSDLSLTKVDANGNLEWNKTFLGHIVAYSVRETKDGGYVIAGETDLDARMIKTDESGNEQWNKTFGGKGVERAFFAWQSQDGSYILGGPTTSYGTGHAVAWLIKTDAGGNETWNKTFGGTQDGAAIFALQTSDGGYVLAGSISSFNDEKTDMVRSSRPTDAWLIRTDANGNELWNRSFGGKESESFSTVVQESDGGFLISGTTNSFGAGSQDCWVVRTDPDGNEQWNRTFGGKDSKYACIIKKASDGGYILAGSTGSYGAGELDAWLLKIDASGNEQWNRTFSGKYAESVYSFDTTTDGGYILAGAVYGDPFPNDDALLIKVTGESINGSASDGKSTASSGKSVPGFEIYLTVFSLVILSISQKLRR
ncbi:MAG: hypothetical protein FIB08_10180 [Candidatus Methanoperedens sp.]|nr:hypothetical protein [Candidatus Methanoperedens sp.]